MKSLKIINMALAFTLELCMLAAYIYWGFHLPVNVFYQAVAGIGVPLVVIILWGIWLAPNADMRLRLTWLVVLKTVLFGLASVALISVGEIGYGILLLSAFIASEILGLAWGQEQDG
jgi:hypothetical protein